MRVLVTGSKGVIGTKLVELLKKRRFEVFGIDLYHCEEIYGHNLGKIKDSYSRCDISEFRQIEGVVKYFKPDFVFNLAAEFGRWNGERFYEQVWKTNAIGLKHIIRLQEEHGFKLIHCSSSEVYGDYQGVMYEDVLSDTPIAQLNDYAMSKRVNEQQVQNSRTQFGTKTVLTRIFNTYGPGEWFHPFRSVNCIFTYNLLNKSPITVFRGHTRSSTYIDDAVRAIANIADNFKDGELYNITSAQEHTIESLVEMILKHTGARRQLVNYVDHHEILTTISKKTNNDKAVRDLDFSASVSLDKGVKLTVKWMKDYYKL